YSYTQSPWSTKYPELAQILSEGRTEASRPKGNKVIRNVFFDNDAWQKEGTWGAGGAFAYFTFTNNLTNSDPKFVSESTGNMNLQSSSPAFGLSGFSAIPFDQIGIQRSVSQTPQITNQPDSTVVGPGTQVTFSVTATGAGSLTYQWKKDGTAISGETGATCTVPSAQEANVGSYSCVVSNAYGSVESNAAVLSLRSVPVITTHPQSKTFQEGEAGSLSVIATGEGVLSYQWTKDGAPIPGSIDSVLGASAAQLDFAGIYTVIVSNAYGSVESNHATVAVIPISTAGPTILSQPESQSVSSGTGVAFSVQAAGIGSLNYQWKKNQQTISGATSAVYAIPVAQPADEGAYCCIVADSNGAVESREANLAVNTLPVITRQPVSVAVNPGEPAAVYIEATGLGPLTYQWKKEGYVLSAATKSSLVTQWALEAYEGSYTCVVSNIYGSVESQPVYLTVNDPGAPLIVEQPLPQNLQPGSNLALYCGATGTGALTYQWKKNGQSLTSGGRVAGAIMRTLNISSMQESDEAYYSCEVRNAAGVSLSNSVLVEVTIPPSIIQQPQGIKVDGGEMVILSVLASGENLTYAWTLDGWALTDGQRIYGSGTSRLTILDSQEQDAGLYEVTVKNSIGAVTSTPAPLHVHVEGQTAVQTWNLYE
ncbi:immunoglobulin domain-containing protein, partial [bacterium]|nr:immunoglobulin domain-containing protein [bacterium]